MTVSISAVKSQAKKALFGNWVIAIVSALTVIFSFLMIQNIAWVFSLVLGDVVANFIMILLTVLLCGPLALGVFRLFWRLHGGLVESPANAFYYFSSTARYYKAIKLCFMLSLRLLMFAAVFYLPAILLYIISSPDLYDFLKMPIPMWSQYLQHLVNFFSSIGAVLIISSMLRFYLAPVLVIADDEMDAEEAVHMSAVIAKTSFTDFIFLAFSLLFWIIISLLFIPLIFTLPYFIMCYVVHSKVAIKDYNERIKKLIDDKLPSFVAGV